MGVICIHKSKFISEADQFSRACTQADSIFVLKRGTNLAGGREISGAISTTCHRHALIKRNIE